jgi:hypothetical protein
MAFGNAGSIRNSGFGLNYNRGFGSGKGFAGGGYDPRNQGAADAYQDRLTRDRQNRFASDQAGRDFDRSLSLQREGDASDRDIARINADAGTLGVRLQQDRFDQVFPYLRDALGQGESQSGYQGQGPVGTQPAIDADRVYTEQQTQQQVNAERAGNDAATASRQRQLSQQMAARGYGSRSPLAMELGVGLQNANLQANTDSERQLRFDAAGANARQLLSAQTAREGQYASRQQEDIERGRVRTSRYNAMLNALAGLV